MIKNKQKITLQQFISMHGNKAASVLLNSSEAACKSWRYGYRQPTVSQAKKIIISTNYLLDWESIYGPIEDQEFQHKKNNINFNNKIKAIIQKIGKNENVYGYEEYQNSIWEHAHHDYKNHPENLSDQIDFFKGLVICEKFFKWGDGSGAPNIKLFWKIKNHPFIERNPFILNNLLNWIGKNKGCNGYTPFGARVYKGCRSFDDIKRKEESVKRKSLEYAVQQKLLRKKKIEKKLKKQKDHTNRIFENKIKKEKYIKLLNRFLMINKDERINLLLNQKLNFPINFLPEKIWFELLDQNLGIKEINYLLSLIPRHTNNFLKKNIKPKLLKKKKITLI